MEKKQSYLVNGLLCTKEKEFYASDTQVKIYHCLKIYIVFLNNTFAFELNNQDTLHVNDLIEFTLSNIIKRWEIHDDARQFSRKRFQTSNPSGNMLIEFEEMMKCKKRLQKVINQEWIDCVKTLLIMS
jgi:hypothetical protein